MNLRTIRAHLLKGENLPQRVLPNKYPDESDYICIISALAYRHNTPLEQLILVTNIRQIVPDFHCVSTNEGWRFGFGQSRHNKNREVRVPEIIATCNQTRNIGVQYRYNYFRNNVVAKVISPWG